MLVAMLSTLPKGKAVSVTLDMFGWACGKTIFATQLRNALKTRRCPARVVERAGAVYVIPGPNIKTMETVRASRRQPKEIQ